MSRQKGIGREGNGKITQREGKGTGRERKGTGREGKGMGMGKDRGWNRTERKVKRKGL